MRTLFLILLATGLLPRLEAQDPVVLDTVRVTAVSRIPGSLETPFRSIAVIDRTKLGRQAGLTVADILATTLGVDVGARSAAQADVSVRGSSYEQVLVMVDGVRVSDAQTGHFNLNLAVPLDGIERIEVLRGPASAVYGADAVGGVINIVTRRGGALHGDARAWGGSFTTYGAATGVNANVGSVGVRAGGDIVRSDGHRPGTDYGITQARVALDAPLAGGRVMMDLGSGRRHFGAADFYGPYPSYESTIAGTGTLRFDSRPDAPLTVQALLSTRRHSDVFTLFRDNPSVYQNEHVSRQNTAEIVARFAASDAWRVAVGTEFRDLQLESARLGDRHEGSGAAFAEATWGDPQRLTVNGGLRLDHSKQWGSVVSPSAAASVPLSRIVWLRGSVGRGFRGPTWTERYYQDPANVGSPDLQPEHFVATEVGARVIPSAQVHADIAFFTRHGSDVIDWAKPDTAPSDPWRTMNFAEATYMGLEGQVQARTGVVDWTLFGTWLDFEATGAEGYNGKYTLRPVISTAGVSFSFPLPGQIRVSLDGVRVKRIDADAYFLANSRIAWRMGPFGIDLEVLNLADAQYLDPSAQPAAGRAVYVTGRWR